MHEDCCINEFARMQDDDHYEQSFDMDSEYWPAWPNLEVRKMTAHIGYIHSILPRVVWAKQNLICTCKLHVHLFARWIQCREYIQTWTMVADLREQHSTKMVEYPYINGLIRTEGKAVRAVRHPVCLNTPHRNVIVVDTNVGTKRSTDTFQCC